MSDLTQPVDAVVEHLFRHEAGRIVSVLTGRLGIEYVELVEDIVQEALLAALRSWPRTGVPANPSAWLMQVARNRAIDRFRRETNLRRKLEVLAIAAPSTELPADLDEGLDDQLAMILMCCHPMLSRESQVAVTLKTVSGFSVDEIARALLSGEEAVTKRITRARHTLRDQRVPLALPERNELTERLKASCDVLYLLFNEGYSARGGDNLTRADLCQEAIRLACLLTQLEETNTPDVHALLALMCLQASRLPARTDTLGSLVLLSDQDRARWDQPLIQKGMHHLEHASKATAVTPYHIEAGIAACHAVAGDERPADWERILALYDKLMELNASPVVRLNRAVAVSKVHGPEKAELLVRELESERVLRDYYLLPAIHGDMLAQIGNVVEASVCFKRALDLPCTVPERKFLERRIVALGKDTGVGDAASPRPL